MTEQRNALENPALLIVDMQNDFVRRDAPLQMPDALGTIAAHQALIAAFRKLGRPVIYTKFLSTKTPSLGWLWSPECEPPTKCCWQGHFRHYPDPELFRAILTHLMASISHSGRRVAQRDMVYRASGATHPNGLGSPPKAAHQGPVAALRFLDDVPHRPANRAYPRDLGVRSNGLQ